MLDNQKYLNLTISALTGRVHITGVEHHATVSCVPRLDSLTLVIDLNAKTKTCYPNISPKLLRGIVPDDYIGRVSGVDDKTRARIIELIAYKLRDNVFYVKLERTHKFYETHRSCVSRMRDIMAGVSNYDA